MAAVNPNRNLLESKLEKLQTEFSLDNEQLKQIMAIMLSEMERGLNRSDSGSSLDMLLSYVSALPNGTERGSFLALDLGGTNFRVLLINIKDGESEDQKSKIEIVNEIFALPEDVKLGDGESFFDHIAKCIAMFCKDNDLNDTRLLVGFTFSFPLRQNSLRQAVLLGWSKGFNVSGVIGKDVVKMLHDAIKRRGDINCEVVAIVNDSVGTLMSCAHSEPNCRIGLIVGTGCNACYMEKISNIKSAPVSGLNGSSETPSTSAASDTSTSKDEAGKNSGGYMCINMEWGGFGDNGVLSEFRNEYDEAVDAESNNPIDHLYEKMISGKYMGELVRLVLCKLVDEGGLFGGQGSERLYQADSFKTAFVSEIETKAAVNNMHPNLVVKNILRSLGLNPDDTDCAVVRRVCAIISTRAARLCAAGIAAVAQKIKANHPDEECKRITVGVDGTVYKRHPTFSKLLKEKVDELCEGSDVTVDFAMSYDGSGKGAALVAAAIHRDDGNDLLDNT